jgi:hypothetical protein
MAAVALTLAALALPASGTTSPGDALESSWKPVYEGIAYKQLTRENPAPLSAHAVRIDLKDPKIRFLVTPANGKRDKETDGLKTSTFLKKHGCQVAINASPFAPVGEDENEPRDVLGLSVSKGDVYSQAHGKWGALLITEDNKARIEQPPFKTEDVYNAVGGFHLLLKDGKNVGTDGDKHPRTAVGISKDGRYLYLIVIDGRQTNHSLGASTRETAAMLKSLGAHDALNLDGGGSTTLVFEGDDGSAKVMNRPVHLLPGVERVNANHLGVFAQRLKQE